MAAIDSKMVLRLAIFHLLALSHMMDSKLLAGKSAVLSSRTMRSSVSPDSTSQLPSTTFIPSITYTAKPPSTTQAPSTTRPPSPSTATPSPGSSSPSMPQEFTIKDEQKLQQQEAPSQISSISEEITTQHLEHRIPSRLEEKLESLSCDILPLPSESRLWKGNETQELMLPIMVPPDCDANENEENECDPNKASSASWAGTAEMQSGDILLVRIDDARLVKLATKMSTHTKLSLASDDRRQPETAVYQVTRPGHAHCDVTEGVLLDITPLEVDGRKIVTLYDKDLTEGVNLLIVVSAKWGGQCVRLRVVVKSDTCGDNQECSTKGVCFSNVSMEGYECQCCPGYVGPHCEEKDACFPSPCKNNGICVDISQGHDGNIFQCLCPYGFTGKTCEEETNPCDSSPCLNGGTCFRNVTTKQFRCDCEPGFAGALCQHSQECESSPCVHGICVNEDDGYRCFCQPGFAGQQCEYEYNECESSPCINGGTCMDHIDGYTCICGRGFTAKRCHVKIDLCDPNPCHNHHYCKDRGNNYSCECPKGFSGPDCLIPSRAACSVNPCHHGGTCWSSVQSFYCACKPGYTGKTCQDEFVLETMPSAYPDNSADNEIDAQMPVSVHLDHLHNLYVAAGTLACAVTIVMLTVAACHCRVHETYKRCFLSATPLLPCKVTRLEEIPSPSSSRLCQPPMDKSKSNGQSEHRSFPAMDNSEMYYTLDFSDSQSSPLIQ